MNPNITSLSLFFLSSVYAVNSPAFPSPLLCFDNSIDVCVLSVGYPLQGYRDDRCGYPGFEIDCYDNKYEGRPYMNISNHIYHVRHVDYGYKFINLVDIDVEGIGCPQPKRNFSFPPSPSWVNYHINGGNITVFYNCSRVPPDAETHLLCSQDDDPNTPSYAFYDTEITKGFDWYQNCAQNVVVPVSRYSSNYSDAMKEGFYMFWSATDWCEDCERSGGLCWSSSYYNSTGCACNNDVSYNRTCPPEDQGLHNLFCEAET